MNVYLAGAEGDIELIEELLYLRPRLLVSYWYIASGRAWDAVEWAERHHVPLFLDSGAYTAMTSGGRVDLQKYIDFCLKEGHRFEAIASLDVIMDWQRTEQNHAVIREAGIKAIPAFHVGEPFDYLQRLCRTDEYIALGIAGNHRKHASVMRWLIQCQSIAKGKKLHGFGLTHAVIMRSFNWFSVDSTTWHCGARFRRILDREDLHQSPYHGPMTNRELTLYNTRALLEWTRALTEQRKEKINA